MPDAVFIEHAVRVVHPAVLRCVMKQRTVFCFHVGAVDRVGQCYAFPAYIILGFAHRGAPLRSDNVENHILSFIRREVERHGVVGLGTCQAHVYGLGNLSVDNDIDSCVVGRFLYRQHDISLRTVDTHQRVADSEMLYLHSFARRERQRKQGEAASQHHGDNVCL